MFFCACSVKYICVNFHITDFCKKKIRVFYCTKTFKTIPKIIATNKMEINLIKNSIPNLRFYEVAEHVNFLPCIMEKDGLFDQTFCSSLTREFEMKIGDKVANSWFDIKTFISDESSNPVGYLKICDSFGILKTLRKILVTSDTRKLFLGVAIKIGTGTNNTVVETKKVPLEIENTNGVFEAHIDFRTNHDNFLERFYEINLILDSCHSSNENVTAEYATDRGKMSINKKILHDEILTDAVIVSKEGTHVKCHKIFLAAHSSVIGESIQTCNNQQQQQIYVLDMPNVSEKSVKALLAFLYYWDQTEAEKNSVVAYELLRIGHSYNISLLEKRISKLILKKYNDWLEADVAVSLFGFVRGYSCLAAEELRMKAIDVMKTKLSELNKCPAYQDLFRESPQVAMELCELAFQS